MKFEKERTGAMRKKYSLILILITVVCIITLAAVFISTGLDVRATDVKPGSSAIIDRDDAIEIAEQVANWNNAGQDKAQSPALDGVTELTVAQYTDEVSELEITSSEPLLSGDTTDSAVWVVSFTGSFSPRRCPVGTEPPVYSIIEISLDSRDGSVISVRMHD